MTAEGLRGKDGVEVPEAISIGTKQKYVEAYEMITGKKWE